MKIGESFEDSASVVLFVLEEGGGLRQPRRRPQAPSFLKLRGGLGTSSHSGLLFYSHQFLLPLHYTINYVGISPFEACLFDTAHTLI